MVAKKPAAAMKRKGISKLARLAARREEQLDGKTAMDVEGEPEAEEVEEDAPQAQDEPEENQEAPEKESEEQRHQREEQEVQKARGKELKAQAVEDLKALAKRFGLDEKQKKAALVEAVVAREAEARAEKAAREARRRAAVVKKKAELEALSISDLAKACDAANVVGARTKHDRVAHLLKRWLDADGIAKALQQQDKDARRQELLAMDSTGLRQLCEERGLNPFVQEVAADRLLRHEEAKMSAVEAPQAKEDAPKVDLVDSLLMREKEKQQQEKEKERSQAALAARRKELKAKGVEELKEALASRDLKVEGNKEALLEALLDAHSREEAAKARRAQLAKLPLEELKDLLLSNGLDAGKRKREELVVSLLAHEAQRVQRQQALDGARQEAFAAKTDELAGKSATELKELCVAKELAVGGSKDALAGRLAECARQDGEIDRAANRLLRAARARELHAMERATLLDLCEKAGVDPCVKEVMVERIMSHDEETKVDESAAKRAKRAKH